ncbi:MAG: hypothetical protein ACYT04_74960, partial [Nostoc sp.]
LLKFLIIPIMLPLFGVRLTLVSHGVYQQSDIVIALLTKSFAFLVWMTFDILTHPPTRAVAET